MAVNISLVFGIVLFLSLTLLVYLRLANKFKITSTIVRNNNKRIVVLGAGIIFPLTVILFAFLNKNISIYFLLGVIIVAGVSFIDDLKEVKITHRLLIQIIACLLIFYTFHIEFNWSSNCFFEISCLFFIILSYLNAYNFMDGINGMLGLNSLISLTCLAVINTFNQFADLHLLLGLIFACVLFLFGNLKSKPIFISGDVGSISLGFIIGYFILKIYFINGNPIIFLLMTLYFIDVGSTTLINLKNRINIFKSHRNFLYEKLVHEKGISDIKTSGCYGGLHFIVCCLVTFCYYHNIDSWIMLVLSIVCLVIFYFIFRGLNFPNETRTKINN